MGGEAERVKKVNTMGERDVRAALRRREFSLTYPYIIQWVANIFVASEITHLLRVEWGKHHSLESRTSK